MVRAYECDLIRELNDKRLGMAKLIFGEDVPADLVRAEDVVIDCPGLSSVGDDQLPMLYVLLCQVLALFRCMADGAAAGFTIAGWCNQSGGAGIQDPPVGCAMTDKPRSSLIETPGSWQPLDLSEFEPRSMLQVKRTLVDRARFPVVDVHAHMCFSSHVVNGVHLKAERQFLGTPEEMIPVMDRKNVRMLNNLTGGFGEGLNEVVARYDQAHPGRFCAFTEPSYAEFLNPNYPRLQAEAIEQAKRSGAKGLKLLKTLGLFLRENITTGELVQDWTIRALT